MLDDTVVGIADSVRNGRRSAVGIVQEVFARIAQRNSQLNAFVHLDPSAAVDAARTIDSMVARGVDPGPLAGVPFGIKDTEDCLGMPTTHGSVLFRHAGPATEDSVHVRRLKSAGAIAIGKVAASEFGMDGVTHTKAWGTTRNPWNLHRTPSGSSGGSAAAVAGALVPFCTSSDGGGSTRVPASFTGMVGLKPSHGRIPRQNGVSDLSCLGAITATVRDTSRYLDVVAGADLRDRMSLPRPCTSYEQVLESLDVTGLRVVWSPDLGFAPVEPEVAERSYEAALTLIDAAKLERSVVEVSITNVYSDWARLAGHRLRARLEAEGHWPRCAEQLSNGPRMLIERYGHSSDLQIYHSQAAFRNLELEVSRIFERTDVILCPTAGTVAYAAIGPMPEVIAGQDASETSAEPFTIFANVCWLPSISVPAGLGRNGLPVGLMITASRHRDDVVLRLAHILERARPWPLAAPDWLPS